MIRIQDPDPATIESYCKQAAVCVTMTHDLEVFQLINHIQAPPVEIK